VDFVSLPKVSLHDHLDGGLRPQTVVELAASQGIELPAQDMVGWFAARAASREPLEYLAMFDVTVAVMQTAGALERVAREFVLDLAADGVVYAEIRWAPGLHLAGGLTLDQAVDAVSAGIAAGLEEAPELRVGQLLCALRHAHDADAVARLAVARRDRGVVGVDYAGPEVGNLPTRHRAAFDYLAGELMPVTVHAGQEGDLDSIRSALLDGRALRIGHGVRVATDIGDDGSLGAVATWIRDRGIALDLCPSSNVDTGATAPWGNDLASHPFDRLYRLGFAVTVSPDSRLMSATTLSRELELLTETFGYDLDDHLRFQLNAVAAAFLPRDEREALADRILTAFPSADGRPSA
jgi:adenosine deaminase